MKKRCGSIPISPASTTISAMPMPHLGMLDKALAAYDKALANGVDPAERLETTHSRSICLIAMGQLEEGFAEFEIRNNPRFRAYLQPHDQGARSGRAKP